MINRERKGENGTTKRGKLILARSPFESGGRSALEWYKHRYESAATHTIALLTFLPLTLLDPTNQLVDATVFCVLLVNVPDCGELFTVLIPGTRDRVPLEGS